MSELSLSPTSPDEQITVCMASIPERMDGMIRTINSLLPYCDNFDVYLNRYPRGFHVPVFDNPKVKVFRSPPDLGARGKLYMVYRSMGYFLTVDDDLIYPSDYVYKMMQCVEKYKREAIIGIHGVVFVQCPDPMQPQTRVLFSHAAKLCHDLPVHMLGTGAMAWHHRTINIDWRKFNEGKIDEQTAVLAQENRVPMLVMQHPDDWVVEDEKLKLLGALRRQTKYCEDAVKRQQRPWHLFLPQSWKEYQRFP